MGDITIAADLRRGVKEIVDTLGETVTFARPSERGIDPNELAAGTTDGGSNPTQLFVVDATIVDVEDHLVDGAAIRVSDQVATFLAGQDFNGTVFRPSIKDVLILGRVSLTRGEDRPGQWSLFGSQVWNETNPTGERRQTQYEIVHISTNRVSGIDVSHEAIIR